MALAYEGNTSLAFDTDALRKCGTEYADVSKELSEMASKLDGYLTQLKSSGWTTPAGTAFHAMVNTNWKTNVDKYADLLDTLQGILEEAATQYDDLVTDHIEALQL